MKVIELIALLKQAPEGATVLLDTSDSEYTQCEECANANVKIITEANSAYNARIGDVLVRLK